MRSSDSQGRKRSTAMQRERLIRWMSIPQPRPPRGCGAGAKNILRMEPTLKCPTVRASTTMWMNTGRVRLPCHIIFCDRDGKRCDRRSWYRSRVWPRGLPGGIHATGRWIASTFGTHERLFQNTNLAEDLDVANLAMGFEVQCVALLHPRHACAAENSEQYKYTSGFIEHRAIHWTCDKIQMQRRRRE
ncbi:hypothetical protein BV22DRAFT_913174 [Leucogyrophana mollusca]|uniref:Uncharacterized protein n=1 Tax=Leucogyrophana mollusca TaxID=85980 RepID=A0ACB8AXY9_9AGAM|nr:hypothetical protein BV22DRAFT_913174 [Leucogyrophana mollusca]